MINQGIDLVYEAAHKFGSRPAIVWGDIAPKPQVAERRIRFELNAEYFKGIFDKYIIRKFFSGNHTPGSADESEERGHSISYYDLNRMANVLASEIYKGTPQVLMPYEITPEAFVLVCALFKARVPVKFIAPGTPKGDNKETLYISSASRYVHLDELYQRIEGEEIQEFVAHSDDLKFDFSASKPKQNTDKEAEALVGPLLLEREDIKEAQSTMTVPERVFRDFDLFSIVMFGMLKKGITLHITPGGVENVWVADVWDLDKLAKEIIAKAEELSPIEGWITNMSLRFKIKSMEIEGQHKKYWLGEAYALLGQMFDLMGAKKFKDSAIGHIRSIIAPFDNESNYLSLFHAMGVGV